MSRCTTTHASLLPLTSGSISFVYDDSLFVVLAPLRAHVQIYPPYLLCNSMWSLFLPLPTFVNYSQPQHGLVSIASVSLYPLAHPCPSSPTPFSMSSIPSRFPGPSLTTSFTSLFCPSVLGPSIPPPLLIAMGRRAGFCTRRHSRRLSKSHFPSPSVSCGPFLPRFHPILSTSIYFALLHCLSRSRSSAPISINASLILT